ncbi:sensor histidine kinase [Photobacterium jeanii]|uniref:sensor histidine kinase n=1 Tax=Photobacterium jeanii TaxID=858640 RepID=UPI00083428B0|nr:HAMP domain-containing sensor histidine kinase [Photobacterium jeanii]PST90505.1 sensor histidine kinase [Photobacterium jeanii]
MNFKLRLLLLTALWFALSALVIGSFITLEQQYTEQRTQQMLHRDLAAHMRDDSPLMEGTDYNPVALKSIFHTLMLLGPDFEIYFLDQQGKIRSHAAPDNKVKQQQVDLSPIMQFLDQQTLPILGDDPRNPGQKKVFSAAAITEFGSVIGYLYVVIGSEQRSLLNASTDSLPINHILALALVLVFSFSVLIYALVKRTLLKPISQLAQNMQQQTHHAFCLPVSVRQQVPELQPIGQQFYQMSQHIQQQFLQLQQQESQRRELLMQLSHDLKTPLASVLGYLETWLLQNNQQDPLLSTAHRNAQKLADQLEQQLQLARHQQTAPQPQFESVAVNDIIRETNHNLAISRSNKALQLKLALDKHSQVFGDQQLLQRLFANLLENAIRHAPNASTINISTRQQHDKIMVQVENQIDPQAPHGTLGLGTKIIKSILALHHSELITQATPNEYRQSFSLLVQDKKAALNLSATATSESHQSSTASRC